MRRASFLIAFALAVLLVGRVQADVLYWMFEVADVRPDVGGYVYASVLAVKGSESHYLTVEGETVPARMGVDGAEFLDLTGYDASWSFMVEVYNYGTLNTQPDAGFQLYLAGGSALSSFTDLQKAGFVYSSSGVPDVSAAWHPVVYLPEPSSGLLLLLGFALGALTRPRSRREA